MQDREGTFSTELFAGTAQRAGAGGDLLEMYVQGCSPAKWRRSQSSCAERASPRAGLGLGGNAGRDAGGVAGTAADVELSLPEYRCSLRARPRRWSRGQLRSAHRRRRRDDGRREILAVEVADTESEATYHELFRRLKARGLHGVVLVTSDDHAGLRAAIARHFQGASWQRCQVHSRAMSGAGRGQAPRTLGGRVEDDLRGAGGHPGTGDGAHLRRAVAS